MNNQVIEYHCWFLHWWWAMALIRITRRWFLLCLCAGGVGPWGSSGWEGSGGVLAPRCGSGQSVWAWPWFLRAAEVPGVGPAQALGAAPALCPVPTLLSPGAQGFFTRAAPQLGSPQHKLLLNSFFSCNLEYPNCLDAKQIFSKYQFE